MNDKGNVFELMSGAKTKPLEVERVAAEPHGDLTALLEASLQKVEDSRPAHALR